MIDIIRKFFQRKPNVSALKDANADVRASVVPEAVPVLLAESEPLTDAPATVAAKPVELEHVTTESKVEDGYAPASRHRRAWNRIYPSEAARKRAWRERQKAKEPIVINDPTIDPDQIVTDLTLPASIVEVQGTASRIPWRALDLLLQPGPAAILPAQSIVKPEPVAETQPVAIASEPISDPDLRPIEWEEEKSVMLPPRTPGRIKFLLTQETESQTRARIENDMARVPHQQGGSVFRTNVQAAIVQR